ncbi:MAG: hypothetical protein R2752_15640 [Vicinamibacterales bacterium]
MPARPHALLNAGLFLTTLATLMLEVLDTRLLSVLTWYHFSFFAVSVAMLGMAAGAVGVFIAGDLLTGPRVKPALAAAATAFAVAIAISHVANLTIPFPAVSGVSAAPLAALAVSTIVFTIPFVFSGVVVTLALTRTGAPAGAIYAADLIGAAAGCLAVVWLLGRTDITSTALASAAIAAAGAWCFGRYAGHPARGAAGVALGLLALTVVNATAARPLGVIYPKSRSLWFQEREIEYSAWNAHSNVIIRRPVPATVFLWGPGKGAPEVPTRIAWGAIDGDAGTAFTEWDGDPGSLGWTMYDVTAVPYRLRQGKVGIIGVGGGRDILTALAAGNTDVTGIEINSALLAALRGPYRAMTKIADDPHVTLVHDEARSYLTRHQAGFDVLQMSLIDTWAATGAGAFTLSENGLYTREGWRVFLGALSPTGVFSVSRWFDPESVSETTRLVALGVASLLDAGMAEPRRHLLLVTRGRVATLVVSKAAFTDEDRARIEQAADALELGRLVTPWAPSPDARIDAIANATSFDALSAAVRDPDFDFSPPSDSRPFFFNMLKPGAVLRQRGISGAGVVTGNLLATATLLGLAAVAAVLVVAIVIFPLVRLGRPAMPAGLFGASIAYFAMIGLGFMFVQIPFLQRFSVYLGHPTYTFSIILFLMILAAGAGSWLSDRLDPAGRFARRLPFAIAGVIVLETLVLQPVTDATIGGGLPARTFVTALFVAPLALLLGMCFPFGLRLAGRSSATISAWMWGVNGAAGVMASIVAVMASMWLGIDVSLWIAAGLYALLVLPLGTLRAG